MVRALIAFVVINLALLVVANNINPGGRSHGGSWVDSDSNVWIFGGWGFDESGAQEGPLNDLWMFSPSNNSWHWIGGSQSINTLGIYTGSTPYPGARESPNIWITPDKRTAYMFGGYGFAKAGAIGFLQDLWRFDILTRTWTWIKGSDATNAPVNYAATPDATPSGRYRSSLWTYNATQLYLFGGADTAGTRNDVWIFDTLSNNWVFIGGPALSNWYGAYGTTESTTNIPGSRVMTATWTDSDGYFWLYGGAGYASASGQNGILSDVWRFNPMNRGWTFIAGSATINTPGNYGVRGVSSGGIPPARLASMAWFDSTSNEVVIFGGTAGSDSNGRTIAMLSDVWRFRPTTKEFIWVGGDSTTDQLGEFGQQGVPSKFNLPSGRVSSYIGQYGNDAYLFGGAIVPRGRPTDVGRLNDMWHLHLPTNVWTWLEGTNLANQRGIYEVPDFTILSLPSYLSGNIHLEDRYTREIWIGSFIKQSSGSNWNVSAIITNNEKQASLIYSNGALVVREEGSETTACLDPSEVLSDDVVGAAVSKAVLVSDNDIKDPTVLACSGTKWEVNVLQELYIVCREDGSGDWKIFGINFVATLTDLVTNPSQSRKRNVQLDSSLFSGLFNCSKANNEVAPFVEAVKWYQRDWKKAQEQKFECIFLHGAGIQETWAPSNNPTDYWSNIGDFTPQCSSKKFAVIDTLRRGWTDTNLQQDFCELITGSRSNGKAYNKLIFAHSMANLVLAAAIQNKYCELDSSAYWYNIQGPNNGSEVAYTMSQACSEEGLQLKAVEWLVETALSLKNIPYKKGSLAVGLRLVLSASGFCKLNAFELHPPYISLFPTSLNGPDYGGVLEIMRKNVHGGMCGTSAIGLVSWDSIYMELAHLITASSQTVGDTDGFVSLASCKAFTTDLAKFSPSYMNSHYLARVNHIDGRCVRSDGWWGVDRKPCLWYANQGISETKYTPPVPVSTSSASSMRPFYWPF